MPGLLKKCEWKDEHHAYWNSIRAFWKVEQENQFDLKFEVETIFFEYQFTWLFLLEALRSYLLINSPKTHSNNWNEITKLIVRTVGGDKFIADPLRSCGPILECLRMGSPLGVPPGDEAHDGAIRIFGVISVLSESRRFGNAALATRK